MTAPLETFFEVVILFNTREAAEKCMRDNEDNGYLMAEVREVAK